MHSTFSTRLRLLLVATLLALGSLLVACGTDPTATVPATAPTVAAPAAATDATATPAAVTSGATDGTAVTLSEWAIAPASIDVAAGHQKFKVTNSGKFPHNFKIVVNGTQVGTANLKAGESATLETDLTAGTYDTLCGIPGHKDKGMAGKVVVK